MEKFFTTTVIVLMTICFGYHAVHSLVIHSYDMAAVNMLITVIVISVGKSIRKL